MANWYEIFDAYESQDCDSLCELANVHAQKIHDYLKPIKGNVDSLYTVHDIVIYFIQIDDFFDGGEADVYMSLFGSQQNYYDAIRDYKENGGKEYVERTVKAMPQSIKEEVGRLGCAILAGRGYIRENERSVILRLA